MTFVDIFLHLGEWALQLVDSPWILLVLVLFTTIDGFFPVVPSESLMIGATVLIVSDGGMSLWLIWLAGAVGAFCGDLIAYLIGRKLPIHRMTSFQSERGQRALLRAELALNKRAPLYIMSARFIPMGRVAVNMTAGAVGFPLARFGTIITFSAVLWAGYSIVLGLVAGNMFEERPLIAVAVGLVFGVTMGWVIDKIMSVMNRWLSKPGHGNTRVGDAVKRGTEKPAPRLPGNPDAD
ncbi:membrane protein DedA, SNARE-associated domain [Ruaniaceae bacterium KH17]|nr:membrane protein DedA, SNARE-associated domain [Ruaniaceae bacterium KH17]